MVNDLLRQKRFLPGEGWTLGKDRLEDRKAAGLIGADRGQDKRYARFSD